MFLFGPQAQEIHEIHALLHYMVGTVDLGAVELCDLTRDADIYPQFNIKKS